MPNDTVDKPTSASVEYGAKRAADYLTMKAHEHGDPDKVFNAKSVISLANTGNIKSTQLAGRNGQYRFKLVDLQDYIDQLYPKHNHQHFTPQTFFPPGLLPSAASKRTVKKYVENHPLWFVATMMFAAFSVGVAAILFVAPWLRTAIGDDYIHSKQPVTTENVIKTENMLTATPVDSELGKKIISMLSRKTGVFDGQTQNLDKEVLSLIRKTSPNEEVGRQLRELVKSGVGPFKTVEQTVRLQFVDFGDFDNNIELQKVKNYNVGACKGDFEYGSTINIYAPLVKHKLMAPGNFSMYTFFAGTEVTFDCDREDGELPTIWINLDEFATSFSLDSAAIVQTSDSVEAKVMVGLQPMVLIPNDAG